MVSKELDNKILIDEDFLAVHETWRDTTLRDVRSDMPEPIETSYGRAVILDPKHDRDEERTIVLGLPHQQGWKPSMYIRAEYMRQQVAPDSRMIVLPNNTFGDSYHSFDDFETAAVSDGDMRPFFEQKVKVLEELKVKGNVELTGYSLGGLTALGIASVGSDRFNVRLINADEAPNGERTPKELQDDFMNSGGPVDQLRALKDSDLQVIRRALSIPRLTGDYTRFGLATLDKANKTIHEGMAGNDFLLTMLDVYAHYPDTVVKLGNVIGSKVFQADKLPADLIKANAPELDFRHVTYDGDYARKHPTGDNPAAHALMFIDAKRGE